LPLLNRPKTFIVAGVNMPLLMELSDLEDEPLSDELIREAIELCRTDSMIYMNDKMKQTAALDGDE
jgi:mannose/fructose-specific phosphotransferase system component IIA